MYGRRNWITLLWKNCNEKNKVHCNFFICSKNIKLYNCLLIGNKRFSTYLAIFLLNRKIRFELKNLIFLNRFS
jgi:hypothetical protein